MRRIAMVVLSAGAVAGCASPAVQTLHYQNGQLHYVESLRPDASIHGVGGVTSVTLDRYYVRFETAQGSYVIPREHFVDSASLPLVP